MNLDEALAFSEEKVKLGYKSDGCTWAPDFGISKWCVMHDVLRDYKPVNAEEADELFFKGIRSRGKRYYPVALIYWMAVRVVYRLHLNPGRYQDNDLP